MGESETYWLAAAIMLALYCVIRVTWALVNRWEIRIFLHKQKHIQSDAPPVPTIDTTVLAQRLQIAREHFADTAHEHRPDFKKPLMVEEKRKEIAELAFFRDAAEREHHETDDDSTVLSPV